MFDVSTIFFDLSSKLFYNTAMGEKQIKENQAWVGIRRAHHRISGGLSERLEPVGLNLTQYEALTLLCERGQARVSAMAETLDISCGGSTRLVTSMEKKGLVERKSCEEDARGAVISITPEGRKLQKKASKLYQQGIEELFSNRLCQGELKILNQSLGELS